MRRPTTVSALGDGEFMADFSEHWSRRHLGRTMKKVGNQCLRLFPLSEQCGGTNYAGSTSVSCTLFSRLGRSVNILF